MTLTAQQRRAKHLDFLRANWRLLAAISWENYRTQGRGMVVVDEEDFIHAATPQYAALRVRYTPASTREFESLPGWVGGKEQGWLASYDPAIGVIVMVLRAGGGLSCYLALSQPSPPQCHASQSAARN